MSNDNKIWLIEPGDVLEVMSPAEKAAAADPTAVTPPLPQARLRASTVSPTAPRRTPKPPPPAAAMHYATLLPLSYLLGPLAILLTPSGRRQRIWVGLGIVSAAAMLAVLVVPYAHIAAAAGLAGPLLWSGLALLATAGGFAVWSRALHVIGGDEALQPARLPRALRRPWLLPILGLLAPGCGLLLAGRRVRAAAILWLLWPAALGGLILLNAGDIWRALPLTVPAPRVTVTLEAIFVAAAAAVIAGLLLWLMQALEGMRQANPRPGSRHGDWYALALGAACLALVVTTNPRRAAHHLDEAAEILQADAFQVIPLYLTLAADRLEPANTAHAIRALALYEDLGRDVDAERLRSRLDEGLSSYVALVAAEAADSGATGTLTPARTLETDAPGDVPAGRTEARDPTSQANAGLFYGMMSGPRGTAHAVPDDASHPASRAP